MTITAQITKVEGGYMITIPETETTAARIVVVSLLLEEDSRMSDSSSRPDCYRCEYRAEVPGEVHSSCHHPACHALLEEPLGQLLALWGSPRRTVPPRDSLPGITVKANPHGIRHGWFNHPYNFDPVWLEECSAFKEQPT